MFFSINFNKMLTNNYLLLYIDMLISNWSGIIYRGGNLL